MKIINVPEKEQISADAKAIFGDITKKMGKVPNLFATIGYSANALKGILQFEDAFSNGVFNAKKTRSWTFTNYIYALTEIPIDFQAAPAFV